MPLSVILHAVVLNPLLYKIDNVLKGVKVGPRTTQTTIVAYADITILVTAEEEIPAFRSTIMCYQEASGARINLAKSNALAVEGWKTTIDVMGIKYQDETKILGITFHGKTDQTVHDNWNRITRKIKIQDTEV
jgi:accessory colonization factor AcfC